MARPKKRSVPESEQASTLLDALKFLGLITKEIGTPLETHVYLCSGWAMVSNGVMTAAHKISEDILACPHNTTLIEALAHCGQNPSIISNTNSMLIKSDKFKAVVPCLDPQNYHVAAPDEAIAPINDTFKAALEAVSVLSNEDAQRIELCSILNDGQSLISTTGTMLFEYWHGLDLPPSLALSKTFAQVLIKCKKPLAQFGCSHNSVTFYFGDGTWIKTQLYAERWPPVRTILDRRCNASPLPPSFFHAVAACQPFSPDSLIHFGQGCMTSHADPSQGASYSLSGLPPGLTFSAKQLLLIKPYATSIDFLAEAPFGGKMLMFFGDKLRGCIAGHAR